MAGDDDTGVAVAPQVVLQLLGAEAGEDSKHGAVAAELQAEEVQVADGMSVAGSE